MQTVKKKRHSAGNMPRISMLIAAVIGLVTIVTVALLLRPETQDDLPITNSTAENLFEYESSDVLSITIRRGEEAPWTVMRDEDGLLTLQGADGFQLSSSTTAELLDAARILPCEEVLTSNPADYTDHLADFGLDAPRHEAIITYADGVTAHLRIGHSGTENNAWYYMTVEGDPRLFTFSRGMVEALFVSRESLWDVQSPTIHKARIDRLTLTYPDRVIQWTLRGDISDTDALDKWYITEPITYPAAADAMTSLLSGIAQLRLGAYIGPATDDTLKAYGFDHPRLTIDIHMAPGTIGFTNALGAVEATDYPESTVTFTVGGAKSDMVDYVRFGDDIFLSSHFIIGTYIDYDFTATMSRYPVLTALGNLAELSIHTGNEMTVYRLIRTEQVAANNELITDEDGLPVWDVTLTCNGETADYHAFEAAYNALTLVTVSGTLPEDEGIASSPHTVYSFTDVDGTVHTVELATFDALHDAVIVDGHAAFYLIKGGFILNLD